MTVKYGCVGPDPQGQRHNGGRQESRAAPEYPAGVLDVLQQIRDEVCSAHG